MKRFFTLALLGGVVWLFATNRVSFAMLDPRPVGVEVEGSTIHRAVDDLEAKFFRLARYEDTLMLFGGKTLPLRNAIQHARLAGLPIRDARSFARHSSDFHLFGSEAGGQAKELADPIDFIAANRMARAALDDALAGYRRGVRSKGSERPCLYVRGAALQLDAINVPGEKKGLSTDAARAFARARFVLVEEAMLQPCEALLR